MGRSILVIIFGIVILSSSLFVASFNSDYMNQEDLQEMQGSQITYTESDPIIITEEADLNNYSFAGTGSSTDPYIIENLHIHSLGEVTENSANVRSAIVITEVSYHFLIRNNYLTGAVKDVSIYISELANVSITIEDNRIEGTGTGVQIWYTDAIIEGNNITDVETGIYSSANSSIIQNNNFASCSFSCIDVRGYGSIVQDNIIQLSDKGMEITFCSNILVRNNVIDNTDRDFGVGIDIVSSNDIRISGNEFFNGNLHGIFAQESYDLEIFENYIHDFMGASIEFRSVNDSRIFRNELENNHNYAIRIDAQIASNLDYDSYRNTIYHNSFTKTERFSSRNSEGLDSGFDNSWFNITLNEGNYWFDHSGSGEYNIDGVSNSVDQYPLDEPPVLFSDFDPDDQIDDGVGVDFSFSASDSLVLLINLLIYGVIGFGIYKLYKRYKRPSQGKVMENVTPSETKFCTKCGAPLSPTQQFCTNCGAQK